MVSYMNQTTTVSREEDVQAPIGAYTTEAKYEQAVAKYVEKDNPDENWKFLHVILLHSSYSPH